MTDRLLLGVVAKEPVYAPELRPRTSIADSTVCARCDSQMVVTRDAIGRERRRCPKCDGVSRIKPHPDEVLIPQGLVRAHQLPPVAPGQLRCQRCARGVEGQARFCPSCLGGIAQEDRAAAQKRKVDVQLCSGYNRIGPRAPHKPRIVAHCEHCRPASPTRSEARRNTIYKPKRCAHPGCDAVFQPGGPRSLFCEAHR